MEHPSLRNLTSVHYARPGDKQNEFLASLGKPHLDSFNYMIRSGLNEAVRNIKEANFIAGNQKISIKIENLIMLPSLVPPGIEVRNKKIWPSECRQRACTYNGRLIANIAWSINNIAQVPIQHDFGRIPIMIKSDLCHLKGLSPKQLVKNNEHAEEWGGYFVIKGSEKIIRMLLLTRRNFPIAIKRNSWKQRGTNFSNVGVLIRCVQSDQTSTNNVLHFVTDGTAKLMISYKRSLFYIPIILVLKCLINSSDECIFKSMTAGYEDDFYMTGCTLTMLRDLQENKIITHNDARCYFGRMIRTKVFELSPETSDGEICDFIVQNCICIHLDNFRDKFNCLVLMFQKLFCVIQNKCLAEGVDTIMSQELLLGGHLYQQVIKDRLSSWLYYLQTLIVKDASDEVNFALNRGYLDKAMKKCGNVSRAVEYFLSTGNISSSVSVGAQQNKGLVIVAENINRMRYMSHFKAVHRGSYFQEMRTTEVRQLQPDAWGFICPVHTPDGTPCGLLNHLTKSVQVTNVPDKKLVCKLPETLVSLGMQPLGIVAGVPIKECYPVMLDGCVIGYLPRDSAKRLVDNLRVLKIIGEKVPNTLEIVLLPKKDSVCQFPGLFLFTGPARMMRPVFNLAAQQIELIGTLEQVYLDICLTPEEAYEGVTTHQELSKDNFLSNLACLIPMPDCNQSPRNMYQCQMGKQTMGTPCHTWHVQAETKLYRLQTPASPLFRPVHYDNIEMDNFAMGVNAVVAVVSYTGYDMEDAMIINKSSFERGFAHGSILKSEFIELEATTSYFGLDPERPELVEHLGPDGLPFPGSKLTENDPMCCYYDGGDQKFVVEKYRGKTEVIVDNVRLCGYLPKHQQSTGNGKACITYRLPRNPSVGDKFASRAGQKGICSYLWQAEDLPFTETGLVPDIVFNPHGFPSRMTIAMMIECMAGKSAAVHGLVHDASPFKFTEKNTAIDYFGKMLQAGGYNYYGTERMYSGLDGREMNVDIFFGIVHYQRLRHMVSDKWQVRSTGAVDVVTRQPIKGRKRGGGVRFGEMERDSLLSHGASFLLQDRLFNCSDKSMTLVCRSCGSTVSPVTVVSNQRDDKKSKNKTKFSFKCTSCEDGGQIENMPIPHIFKYLSAQLASVNIKLKLDVGSS